MTTRMNRRLLRLATIFVAVLLSLSLTSNVYAQLAQLQLNPSSGPPGTTITVTGSGFDPNSDVLVGPGVFASEPVSTQRVTTNQQGQFTVQVTIPTNADPDRRWVVAANPIAEKGSAILADFDVTREHPVEEKIYVVRPGDYLSRIALQFNTSVPALVRANPEIDDPNLVFVGQELMLPGGLEIIPETGSRVYVVKRGDTLSEIAQHFGVTTQKLANVNDIVNPRRLVRGQRLEIPTPVNPIPDTGETVYIVQPGDTLSEIAIRFGTTVSELVAENPEIDDPNLIFPGQRFVIPDREEI